MGDQREGPRSEGLAGIFEEADQVGGGEMEGLEGLEGFGGGEL